MGDGKTEDESFLYRRIMGILLFIETKTRHDICLAVGQLAIHVKNPLLVRQRAVIRVLKYLEGSMNIGLQLDPGSEPGLCALLDVKWASKRGEGRRSRSDMLIFYGNDLVYYSSVLQKGVTVSITEAEYVALSDSSKDGVWRS